CLRHQHPQHGKRLGPQRQDLRTVPELLVVHVEPKGREEEHGVSVHETSCTKISQKLHSFFTASYSAYPIIDRIVDIYLRVMGAVDVCLNIRPPLWHRSRRAFSDRLLLSRPCARNCVVWRRLIGWSISMSLPGCCVVTSSP